MNVRLFCYINLHFVHDDKYMYQQIPAIETYITVLLTRYCICFSKSCLTNSGTMPEFYFWVPLNATRHYKKEL